MKKNIHLTVVGFLSLKLFFFLVIIFAGWLIFGIETNAFYYCLIGLFSLTIFWLILYKKKKLPEQTQSLIQFSLDIGVENLLIQFSGGLESPFIFLLILDIFLGAYLLPQKKILFVVAYASSFYAIFSTCAYLGLLPDMLTTENVFEISSDVYFYYVVYMRVFIFFMIGYLASQLSSRIFSQKATIERIQYFTEKILFQMKSGLISTDEEDRIIYANKAATDILNRDFSDLIGKPWQSFFLKKEDISSSEKQFNDDGSETEWQILHPDENDFIPVAITLSHFHDELDHIAGKTIMFRDLTVIKEMEKLKSERKKMQTLGEMASMLAHEIKNPLASICGSLEVLSESEAFHDLSSKILVNVILKESDRLTRCLHEFLTLSGDVPLKKELLEIKDLTEEVILLVRNHAEISPDVKFFCKYNRNVSYQAYLDEDGIKQMLFNLVLNGAQAIEKAGSVTIQLSHQKEQHFSYIKLEVTDTGRGIPQEDQKEIFKPFFTKRSRGIGLGLSVCHKIAEKHNWSFSFHSELNKGTTFTILIPEA